MKLEFFLKTFSDPSIVGDTPFKSGKSPTEIYCQEISNEPMTRTTDNIIAEIHYDVYREIQKLFVPRPLQNSPIEKRAAFFRPQVVMVH